jgi:hypothetical protein
MRWIWYCILLEGEGGPRAPSAETPKKDFPGREVGHMDLTTVLLVLFVVVVLGGGGWGYSRYRR